VKLGVLIALIPALLWSTVAYAHDASGWGGLFRSTDHGTTWFLVSPGTYPTVAVAVAVSPTDGNHLLLATDAGLLRSRNGGRDWTRQAPAALTGAVFAVAFASDGQRALVATAAGVFRGDADDTWRRTRAPRGTMPARALFHGAAPDRAYLAGWSRFVRTDDWGASWSDATAGLFDAPVTSMLVIPGHPDRLHLVAGGQIWSTSDGARTWTTPQSGIGRVDVLGDDAGDRDRLWAAQSDRVLRSDDRGATWRATSGRLPEPNASVRGIRASDGVVVVTTDRGMFRTSDGGERWVPLVDNLPAHLEAAPLVRDPSEPATLYAGFSVLPYPQLWLSAVDARPAWQRIDEPSLVAVVAGLVVLGMLGVAGVRRLRRRDRIERVP
jgi:photosystem II stability/assembly factor-like uncharacterized protein